MAKTDDIVARLAAAHKLVSFWPERDMAPGAIKDLGMGFMHLLALRNLVPEAMSTLTEQAAQIERLKAEGEEAHRALALAGKMLSTLDRTLAEMCALATTAERERDEARAEVERAWAIVSALAHLSDSYKGLPDTHLALVSVGTLRRASAALTKGGENGEG